MIRSSIGAANGSNLLLNFSERETRVMPYMFFRLSFFYFFFLAFQTLWNMSCITTVVPGHSFSLKRLIACITF
ncbi:MAG: hypothetical protein A2042_09375 [Candidatus Schekmanbacteria bacterium GWA2_38_11]|uniref:Uncharacterized protein n=1 Tax=Candidatus Schekmanbacteria bacterium GWA2_38_11 TaxID=1817876 RepID=A0A1F7RML2_9BACT|nr:MAG: hypothetical protein A2042_09375 [Candidatus Schekmanbacteria bacterium GWA2_38_11]